MTVRAECRAGEVTGAASARLFVRFAAVEGEGKVVAGPALELCADATATLTLTIPEGDGMPVRDLGFEITSPKAAHGALYCDRVTCGGAPALSWKEGPPLVRGSFPGWVIDADMVRGAFSDDRESVRHAGKNEGRGILVTGTTDWRDYSFTARVKIHLADRAGILVRYQGLQRYVALVQTRDRLQLVRRWYGSDTVLAEAPSTWALDELHELRLTCHGTHISGRCDGKLMLEAE
jgi:hypothetical protein